MLRLALVFAMGLMAPTSVLGAERSLTLALPAAPLTLDPHQISTSPEFSVVLDLYEGLTSYGPTGDIAPGIAASWSVSGDGLTWTFQLSPHARWSDGTEVTAADVVEGFRHMLDPGTASPYAGFFFAINGAEALNNGTGGREGLGVEAVAPDRVDIRLNTADPAFPKTVALPAAVPRPVGRSSDQVLYNGAYMLADVRANDSYRLVANPHFRNAASVSIQEVVHMVVTDPNTCIRRFRVGDVQVCPYIPTDLALSLSDELVPQRHIPEITAAFYFAANTQRPPLDDIRIRRALNLALDRQVVSDQVLGGLMPPLYGVVPRGVEDYVTDPPRLDFMGRSPFDRQREARQLLADAGIDPENRVKLVLAHSTLGDDAALALYAADQWRALGVDIDFAARDFSAHYAMFDEDRDYHVATFGWISETRDPISFLELFRNDGAYNKANRTTGQIDQLMAQASQETDVTSRAAYLAQAERDVLDSETVFPLMNVRLVELVSDRLSGWKETETGLRLTRHLSLAP